MKRYIKSTVQQAVTSGTTYYVVTLDDVLDYFSEPSENIFMYKAFLEKGWDALNFHKHLYNCFIYEDDLYICVTDGKKIRYQGEMINPNSLPTDIDISELDDYISLGNDQIIHRYITPYELKEPQLQKWAKELEADGVDKKKLLRDAKEFRNK